MPIKQLFKGDVAYPSEETFSDLPKDYTYQPENKSQYENDKGRVLTLEEAFDDMALLMPCAEAAA